MSTYLEEAQVNVTIAQSQAKAYVDKLQCDEKYDGDDEVVLPTHALTCEPKLSGKVVQALDWT